MPRVPFREVVLFLSEFFEIYIFGGNKLGRRCRASRAGAFSFLQTKTRPLSKKHVYCCFGFFFVEKLRICVLNLRCADSGISKSYLLFLCLIHNSLRCWIPGAYFHKKSKKSRNSDENITISRKGTRGKMTPQVSSIQRQSPKPIFHGIYWCWRTS